ncbi:cAMP-activated global transcriptional regulator CRP [mine drainage metagenome]|uniref:cAMP-activated global transcriptional regulator CRP n=1 Tax=mine drainage metagenome TaxID=410659 RepID=A0A1J5PK26_9ZZZZ
MKLFDRLRGASRKDEVDDASESQFFTTGFHDAEVAINESVVNWPQRATEIGAAKLSRNAGGQRLIDLWQQDKYMAGLTPADMDRCAKYFHFYTVKANADLISQGETGSFMIVLLRGAVAVDRLQPWGDRLRLTEVRAGSLLGEMSLVDAAPRWSYCTTLTDSEIAVLEAGDLDRMIAQDPAAACRLIGSLARRLSLRLRKLSARVAATTPGG